MADNLTVSGVGTFKTDEGGVSSAHMQVVKLAISSDGGETLIPADAANGLDVDVTRVGGNVTVVQPTATNLKVDASGVAVPVTDNSGSLTVDAPVGTPVFVRLSDGSSAISSLPVSAVVASPVFVRLSDGAAAITALPITDNSGSLTVDAPKTTPVGVRLSSGTDWVDAIPVTDNAGSITVDDGAGSLTVDGAVSANQGDPVADNSDGWPMKITDGTDIVGISTVSGAKALKVDIVQSVSPGVQTNLSTFTEATGKIAVIGAVYNETISNAPSEDQAAALRLTAKSGLHINIRKNDGSELGISTAPLRTDPTGTTTQPVSDASGSLTVDAPVGTPVFVRLSDGGSAISALPITDNSGSITVDGTLTVNQGATAWVDNLTQIAGHSVVEAASGILKVGIADETGATFSDSNPLPVSVVSVDRTRVTSSVTPSSAETAQAIWTPASGKKFVITSLTLVCSASAVITIYDGTNSAANWVLKGTIPTGVHRISFDGHPWLSAAANNVLRYTTASSFAGELQVHGYEITP